jgi:hypothetical protein
MPPDPPQELRQLVRRELPKDDMRYELHLLRTCLAITQGFASIAEAISGGIRKAASPPRPSAPPVPETG